MKRFEIAIILSILLSSFCLGLGYFWVDKYHISILIVVLNILLLFGFWFKYYWISHLTLLVNSLFICLGVFVSIPALVLLIAMVGVIAHWDLIGFLIRINDLKMKDSLINIKLKHMQRLFFVLLCAGLISAIPFLIQIQFNFLIAVIVSVISVVGLGIAVRISARSN